MIPGIAAREVVVAALGTVYAVSASSEDAVQNALIPIVHNNWGLPTAFAFLAWYVYAPMCAATLAVIKRETKSTKKYAYDYRLFVPDGLFCRICGLPNFFKDTIVMTQYIIVGLIMLTCIFFLLRKFVFKPKKRDCSSGCGKCGGCG